MKKTLVSALTTALVVGAASTTFAAANPFSDVPADHWAYDAVSQLAADGVIEGYGDSTFRGDRNITRYEMAQMVARAMAKNDVSAADKAMIDKLAAEFADELNSLGVRVANLERNADMVKWNGKLEYTYTRDKVKDGEKVTNNNLLFRLEPSAEVNDHWHVNARIDGNYKMDSDNQDQGTGNDSDFRLKRAWAQGDYKNFSVRFGKFSMYGDESISDTTMSGADITIGNQNKLSGVIGGGRSSGAFDDTPYYKDNNGNELFSNNFTASNVFYAGIDYNRNENKGFFGSLRYYRFTNPEVFFNADGEKEKNNIWHVKAGYKFDRSSKLQAYYAHSSAHALLGADTDNDLNFGRYNFGTSNKKSFGVEFSYKGAQKENPKTWGAWIAYRHTGYLATPAATWDVTDEGLKGWSLGANYTFAKNIVGHLKYGHNKVIGANDVKVRQFFGRVEWFF